MQIANCFGEAIIMLCCFLYDVCEFAICIFQFAICNAFVRSVNAFRAECDFEDASLPA
jgi:hypothetical protein